MAFSRAGYLQNSQEVWLKGLELYFYLLLIFSNLAEVSLAHEGCACLLRRIAGVIGRGGLAWGTQVPKHYCQPDPSQRLDLCPPPPSIPRGTSVLPLPCSTAWPEELTWPLPRCSQSICQQKPGLAAPRFPGPDGALQPSCPEKKERTYIHSPGADGHGPGVPGGRLWRLQGALRAPECSVLRGVASRSGHRSSPSRPRS